MSDVVKVDEGSEPAPAPASAEIEFALVLSRTIQAIQQDPAQLRSSVYQLARIALQKDLSEDDPAQQARMAQALESAIQGVEQFERRQQHTGFLPGIPLPQIEGPTGTVSASFAGYAPDGYPAPQIFPPPQIIVDVSPQQPIQPLLRPSPAGGIRALAIGAAAALLVAAGVAVKQLGMPWLPGQPVAAPVTAPAPVTLSQEQIAETLAWAQKAAQRSQQAEAAAESASLGFPLPTNYGTYAANDGKLLELVQLEGIVPDKRVAIASPFQTASKTILSSGSPTFVVFRRDLASISTEVIEARVVAKIMRTMRFDANGKSSPMQANEDNLWSVRGLSYKFKAAPVPGNPEMMTVRPEDPKTALPAGRYVLVLKRQGYDFTIAGKIVSPEQCLERTEATNGTFYSPCNAR